MSTTDAPSPEPHVHVWEPIPNWSGRYRCADCQVLGYRAIVTAEKLTKNPQPGANVWIPNQHAARDIVPYACQKTRCEKPATVSVRGKRFCGEHS